MWSYSAHSHKFRIGNKLSNPILFTPSQTCFWQWSIQSSLWFFHSGRVVMLVNMANTLYTLLSYKHHFKLHTMVLKCLLLARYNAYMNQYFHSPLFLYRNKCARATTDKIPLWYFVIFVCPIKHLIMFPLFWMACS